MKRRTLVLTLIAGLVVFLGVLVFYLPASWVSGLLPAQLKCSELGGSVWSGECIGLVFQGNKLGDATWNLAPGSALGGRLVGDAEVHGGELNIRTALDLKFNGSGELRDVTARIPLNSQVIAQFPKNQSATVVASLKRLALTNGGVPGLIQGTVELHDLRQAGTNPPELGSYRVTFDAAGQSSSNTGQLRDIGGPFVVEGTVTLTPPNAYFVQGFITGRTADAERLVRQEIALGATPDASGRSAFSFEGVY